MKFKLPNFLNKVLKKNNNFDILPQLVLRLYQSHSLSSHVQQYRSLIFNHLTIQIFDFFHVQQNRSLNFNHLKIQINYFYHIQQNRSLILIINH